MGYINNTDKKGYKPFESSQGPLSINQIDTIGPIITELFKVIRRIEDKQSDILRILSRVQYDY